MYIPHSDQEAPPANKYTDKYADKYYDKYANKYADKYVHKYVDKYSEKYADKCADKYAGKYKLWAGRPRVAAMYIPHSDQEAPPAAARMLGSDRNLQEMDVVRHHLKWVRWDVVRNWLVPKLL